MRWWSVSLVAVRRPFMAASICSRSPAVSRSPLFSSWPRVALRIRSASTRLSIRRRICTSASAFSIAQFLQLLVDAELGGLRIFQALALLGIDDDDLAVLVLANAKLADLL